MKPYNEQREFSLGMRLQQLRTERHLSLRELANLTGGKVSHATIWKIEVGETPNPGIEAISLLEQALGVAPGTLGIASAPDASTTQQKTRRKKLEAVATCARLLVSVALPVPMSAANADALERRRNAYDVYLHELRTALDKLDGK